jgi:molecular chaperone Hsp33
MTAWTVNFQEPLLNLFLAGDNGTGAVTGRVFTENVKEGPEGLFYADVVRGRQPPHRSVVGFQGGDPLAAAEAFYAGSEQRRARYFAVGEEELVLVTEHPDCDLAWLDGLTVETVRRLEQEETVVPLERRVLRWHCGCNPGRMMEILAPSMRHDPDELFGTEAAIEIRCPRCAGRHAIRRAELAAFVAGRE